MIQVGLYRAGGDANTDYAVETWPHLDDFVTRDSPSPEDAFGMLSELLTRQEASEVSKNDTA